IYEFYSLGLGDPIGISTHHGIGIGDLLDEVIKDMPEKEEDLATDTIRFCIVGRPNVGKSSLTNAILEDNRVIVSDIGGTTRDSIDTDFVKNRQKYTVVDTAGIKKRGRIYEDTDKYSVLRALEALERSDVALLVIDGEEGVILQDKHVAGYITDYFKAVIIVVNKWDKIEKDSKTMKKYEDKIKAEFQFLDYAEVVFLSAKYNDRVDKLFPAINKAYENFCSEFKTSTLNELLQDMIYANPPKIFNQGKASFNYMTQVGIKPPSFVIFTNNPDFVHFSYERYMQNEFRKNFDLTGTPLKIIFRKKE
ncbi:MAG: ribosome biogenesis GTPase Der, partial [Acholeplasmataceae bacterium]|nr:ribosome biogenesis GTPase Der [Acholeplasmataceae bacterium]